MIVARLQNVRIYTPTICKKNKKKLRDVIN